MTRMIRRNGARVLLLAAFAALPGCNLLDVTNPAAITEDKLGGDDATVTFMVNGVVGEFRHEYAWLAAHGAMFTDEAIQGHPWSPWNVYDARDIPPEGPAYDGLSYQLLQRARGTADELIPRIEASLGDRAGTSVALAKAYAYGGYSYLMVGDYLCEAPVNQSRAYSQQEIYTMAIERFDRAIEIAGAAGAGTGAADVLNLARVGKARAHLNLGEDGNASAAAAAVPDDFEAWVRYTADPSDWQVYNFFHWFAGYRFAGEMDMALEPARFASLADARMPAERDTTRRLGDGLRDGILPFQPSSFSEWQPNGAKMFEATTGIRFASGLEARYIAAEAGALSPTQLRQFINARRAVGGQGDFAGGDAALEGELREQRFRDFFLAGYRMGDLRRYKAQHQVDLWPKGQMPGLPRQYGSQECWPIAQSEVASNPNLGN